MQLTQKQLNLVATVMMSALCLAICATTVAQSTSAGREQDIARANELRRRIEAEQLQRIERLKDSFEMKIAETTQLLATLAEETERFHKEREELLTNEQGKAFAADAISFFAFLQLHENPVVTPAEVKQKQAAAQSLLQSIADERKESNVGYLPSPEVFDELTTIQAWVKDRLPRLEVQRATLKTRIQETPKLQNAETAKTLQKAIEEYRSSLPKLLAEARILGEQLAQAESREVLIEAARLAKLESVAAERDRMLEQARLEIAQLRLEHETQTLRVKAQNERQRVEAEKRYQDTLAELERYRKDADAERRVQDTQSDIARQQKLDQAKREEQLAMLKSPEVQDLLSVVFAKGYWQPGKKTTQPGPLSYSQLRAAGALKEDVAGLNKFVGILNAFENDRPRWGRRGQRFAALSSDEKERLVKAQQMLIEHGPLMVEAGMLAE